MPEPNVVNRTLAIMDNLRFLEALNSECIDLIAIDPPFAANETFTGEPSPPITLDRRKRACLTLSGLLGENREAGWMRDRQAAQLAQRRAKERAEIGASG